MAATTISRPPRIAANPPPTLARFALFIGFCSFAVGLVERIISSNKTSRICVGCVSAWAAYLRGLGNTERAIPTLGRGLPLFTRTLEGPFPATRLPILPFLGNWACGVWALQKTQAKREDQAIISQPPSSCASPSGP